MQRGQCEFLVKARNIEAKGAAIMLLVDDKPSAAPSFFAGVRAIERRGRRGRTPRGGSTGEASTRRAGQGILQDGLVRCPSACPARASRLGIPRDFR